MPYYTKLKKWFNRLKKVSRMVNIYDILNFILSAKIACKCNNS